MPNPFNYGTPVPPEHFVGRWDQVRAIADDLTTPGGLSHALIGGRRFGKTSFLEMLHTTLLQKLTMNEPGDWYSVPVLVCLKELEVSSPQGVFALLLHSLSRAFLALGEGRVVSIAHDLQETFKQQASYVQIHNQECTLADFTQVLEEVIQHFSQVHGPLCVVVLLDETEVVLGYPWTEQLFSQVRSLLYSSSLRRSLRCVLAGSSKIIEVREKGSPLLNMLKVVYLEALNQQAIEEIVHFAGNTPEGITEAVVHYCGGHPFLAQYVMHYAWFALQRQQLPDIAGYVERFLQERYADLEQWTTDLGEVGERIYSILARAETWLTQAEIKRRLNSPQLNKKVGPALITLCYHGLVRHNGSWSEYRVDGDLFKHWFLENIEPSFVPSSPVPPPSFETVQESDPRLEITINTSVFPTAYCHCMTANRFPLVTCLIDNTDPHAINAKIVIEVMIQGVSEAYAHTLDVASGQNETAFLLPRLKREALSALSEIYSTTCRVVVRRLTPLGTRELQTRDYDIQLHAFDTALLAMMTPEGQLAEDLADYLSVFVTPHIKPIERLIRVAVERFHMVFVGYHGAPADPITGLVDLAEARKIVRKQAKALFILLKHYAGIRYTHSPVNYGKQSTSVTQRIRPPYVSLDGTMGQANCIEGAVLFASLLENIGIEPLIVLLPGHALLGWRIWKGTDAYDFLETTLIGKGTFQQAVGTGHALYENATRCHFDQRQLFDPEGFLRSVDIVACRRNGIYPLM